MEGKGKAMFKIQWILLMEMGNRAREKARSIYNGEELRIGIYRITHSSKGWESISLNELAVGRTHIDATGYAKSEGN